METLLRSIVGTMPGLLAYVGPDMRYRFANEAYRGWYDIDPVLLVGQLFGEMAGRDSYLDLLAKARDALSGIPCVYEARFPFKGRTRHVHGSFTPDRAADGSIAGFVVVATDISDRYEIERELRQSERQFDDAFDSASIGMALVSTDGRWLRVNAALCAMLGYTQDEFLRLTFQDITHPDDLEADLHLVRELLDGQRLSYQMEKRYFARDGSLKHAQLSVSLVRDNENRPVHFVSQIEDITARKAAEERLFEEHELSRITLRSIADAVITAAVDGRITDMNPAAERLTGWHAGAALGCRVVDVFRLANEADRQMIVDPMTQAIEGHIVANADIDAVLIGPAGDAVPIDHSAAPICNRAGAVVGGVLIFREVREERDVRRKLRHRANYDVLTGLLNRASFDDRADKALRDAAKRQRCAAMIFIDLDSFKPINDRFGHHSGDRVLQEFARRLSGCVRDGDLAGRWAGDEFGLLLPDTDALAAEAWVKRLLDLEGAPIQTGVDGMPVKIGLSIGIARFPENGIDRPSLMKAADEALYAVKRGGGNGYRFASRESVI